MSERTALTLTLIASTLVNGATCAGLMLIGARDEWVGVAAIVLLCAGSYSVSRVVMHYGELDRNRR